MPLFGRDKTTMVSPEDAIPGRDQPIPVSDTHVVLGTPMAESESTLAASWLILRATDWSAAIAPLIVTGLVVAIHLAGLGIVASGAAAQTVSEAAQVLPEPLPQVTVHRCRVHPGAPRPRRGHGRVRQKRSARLPARRPAFRRPTRR